MRLDYLHHNRLEFRGIRNLRQPLLFDDVLRHFACLKGIVKHGFSNLTTDSSIVNQLDELTQVRRRDFCIVDVYFCGVE